MKSIGVFALVLGLVMARAEPVPAKVNQLETKNEQQVSKPTSLETASTRNQKFQIPHSQYQANQMPNAHGQDLKLSQHSQFHNQDQSAQFYGQASQFLSQDQNQQFHNQDTSEEFRIHNQAQQFNEQNQMNQLNQNQAQQFHDQNQAQQVHDQNQAQQLHHQNQNQQLQNQFQGQQTYNQDYIRQYHDPSQTMAGTSDHQEQKISNLLHSQQQMAPTAVSRMHSQLKKQVSDFSAQQQLYSGSVPSEQSSYQDRNIMVNVQDQQSEGRFDDVSRQQSNLFSGLQTTEIKSGIVPQIYKKVSAFERGAHPIVLPRISHTHSSSVVVSGLKNLPSIPALVYSAGPVPSTGAHVLAYNRPWHQGGPYIRQHWQTPYARYVYSHIL